jgi:6,7-dimethyl-8-ribityllumazine synthase
MSTQDAPLPVAPAMAAGPVRVLVVRAPYYRKIVGGLTQGALGILRQAGCEVRILDVAGALELPQAIRLSLESVGRFDAYVALGCVIRGETDHYEHVCREAMAGLMRVGLDHALAIGNGLLTVSSLAQAVARSGGDGHNKGAEAAVAALMQVNVARGIGLPSAVSGSAAP